MHISESPFLRALHTWSYVSQRRSMRDFILFIKKNDLSMTQLGTLMRLHHCGISGISEIAQHLGVTNAAASQMVDRMVQQGLLARTEDPQDRRGKQIALTDQGRDLIQESIARRTGWMETLAAEFSPEQQAVIIQALDLLSQAANRLDQGGSPACPEHDPA